MTSETTRTLHRAIAGAAAGLLVAASAGFGAVYAWTQGAHHGPLLAGLSVAMALGLECAKPLALAWSLTAFGRWRVIEGAALMMLAAVAVSYSLSAELSLVATMRGDAVAQRTAQSERASAAAERYAHIQRELAAIPQSRPAGELQALVDGVLADPRADGCSTINGSFTREHCPRVAEWRAELGRTTERARLAGELARAEVDRGTATAVKPDPGASALATYAALFGLRLDAAMLSEFLALVSVLALEIGSALSGVMLRAAWREAEMSGRVSGTTTTTFSLPALPAPGDHPDGPSGGGVRAVSGVVRDVSGESNVVGIRRWIEAHGGTVTTSTRKLASELGRPRATVHDELRRLADSGVIHMQANRRGLRLAVA